MALAGSRTDEPESTHINYKLRDLLRRGLNAIYNYIWGFACRTCNQKILKILWKPASFIFPVTERVENSRYARSKKLAWSSHLPTIDVSSTITLGVLLFGTWNYPSTSSAPAKLFATWWSASANWKIKKSTPQIKHFTLGKHYLQTLIDC